ncbi:PREDICTED: chromatin modification-related protein MEAF6 isoform X3 [Theobroma cacao]|uniref:Chromatin modification-related protein MEAF6 isoform X3 n=1 Tax=Theobroma cacao TaxID=3641 RepID=A0AB32WDC6_THECC|nr:PREDICTED: chromatin modification-related protein MEAF6 isoform X3 [Theobroma cacao]
MSLGQRGSANPAAMLASLMTKRDKLQDDLRNIEKQVYELETNYLQDSSHFGHVLKGFEGFLSSSKNTANLKRYRKFQPEDRLFSLSSVTSPAKSIVQNGHDKSVSQKLKNLEFDKMMEDLILVQVGLRVEA